MHSIACVAPVVPVACHDMQAANELKGTAASSLSYADLIALFGAHAVALCGGPSIPVRVGRVDAGQADPPGRLPGKEG
jgi:hypothetical protein